MSRQRRLRHCVITLAARAPETNRAALFSCPNRGCGEESWMNPMRPWFDGRARPAPPPNHPDTVPCRVVGRGSGQVMRSFKKMNPMRPSFGGRRTANLRCRPSPELGPIPPDFDGLAKAVVTGNEASSHHMLCGVWIPSSRPQDAFGSAPWDDRENKGGYPCKNGPHFRYVRGNARFSLVSGRAIAGAKQKRRPHTGVRRWT